MWRFNNFSDTNKKTRIEHQKTKRKYERAEYEQSFIETMHDQPLDVALGEANHNQLTPLEILANHNRIDPIEILANHNILDPSEVLANQNRIAPIEILANHNLIGMDFFEDEIDESSESEYLDGIFLKQ